MSCSSCTNSISTSGAASCSFGRRSEMISSADRLALAARLQPHQDVAGVLRRREQAELRAGAPRVRRDFRRRRQMTFSIARTWRSVSVERAAGRRQVVEDEPAFVGGGQESGADADRTAPTVAAAEQRPTATDSDQRTPHHRVEQSARSSAIEPRRSALASCRRWCRNAQRASSGTTRDRQHQREQHRDRQAHRQRAEELARHAGEQPERREHDDGRERRADERRHQLLRPRRRRCVRLPPARRWMFSTTTTASSMTRPMATARPPIDIRLIDPPKSRMKTNVGMTAIGSVDRGDRRQPPVAQEDDQDDDGEKAADEDGVAHAGDRVARRTRRGRRPSVMRDAGRQRLRQVARALRRRRPSGRGCWRRSAARC